MRKLKLRVVVVELFALGLLVSIFTFPTLAEEEYQITTILQSPEPESLTIFGNSIAISEDTIVISDHLADIEGYTQAGKVRVFRKGMVSFEMSSLSVNPGSVKEGGSVTISADVTNSDTLSGAHTITLKIDGEVEDEKTVTLNPDETVTVSFEVAASEEGSYSVDVNGLAGSYEVTKSSFLDQILRFPLESIGLVVGAIIFLLVQRRK